MGDKIMSKKPKPFPVDPDEITHEIECCKDPVYFYENYFLVNGQLPTALSEYQKEQLRNWFKDEKTS